MKRRDMTVDHLGLTIRARFRDLRGRLHDCSGECVDDTGSWLTLVDKGKVTELSVPFILKTKEV